MNPLLRTWLRWGDLRRARHQKMPHRPENPDHQPDPEAG
jgi:hypothetical protein